MRQIGRLLRTVKLKGEFRVNAHFTNDWPRFREAAEEVNRLVQGNGRTAILIQIRS